MKNPCLDCERLHRDKNDPVCVRCDARIEYAHMIQGGERWVPNNQPVVEEVIVVEGKGNGWKVCADPECRHQGKRQPIEDFQKVRNGRMSICRDCQSRRLKGGVRRRAAKTATAPKPQKSTQAAPTPERPSVEDVNEKAVVIDFRERPELLADLKEMAAHELRTFENQVLWMLMRAVGPRVGHYSDIEEAHKTVMTFTRPFMVRPQRLPKDGKK